MRQSALGSKITVRHRAGKPEVISGAVLGRLGEHVLGREAPDDDDAAVLHNRLEHLASQAVAAKNLRHRIDLGRARANGARRRGARLL